MLDRLEFERSLVDVMEYWGGMTRPEVYDLMGREVADMVGFDQRNPHHCYDLFNHSLAAVHGISGNSDVYLAIAAFLHDVGKPEVAIEKNGRLVFYGHSAVSSAIAARVLRRMGYSREEMELIRFYVAHHDDFISYALPMETGGDTNPYLTVINEGNIRRYVSMVTRKHRGLVEKHGVGTIMMNLLDLCMSDIRAQAEFVYMNDMLVDSRGHKLIKIEAIRTLLESILNDENKAYDYN